MLLNLRRFLENEEGATAIEYGLIAALIGVVIITAVSQLGQDLETTFEEVSDGLTGAGAAPAAGGG